MMVIIKFNNDRNILVNVPDFVSNEKVGLVVSFGPEDGLCDADARIGEGSCREGRTMAPRNLHNMQ